MDLSQATQLLTWLDEEHRKDKALLMALQSQVDTQKAQLAEQARQFQELQATLARIEVQLPKLTQLENLVQNMRTELAGFLIKQTAEQEAREELKTRIEKAGSETMARVQQMQEQVEALGSLESSITALRDEDNKLRNDIVQVIAQFAEISKRLDAQSQRIDLVMQDAQAFRDGLAKISLAHEEVHNKHVALKAAIEALNLRLDTRIDQLQSALEEMSKKQQADLNALQSKQQERERLVEELSKGVKAAQVSVARWSRQIEEFTAQFEQNRKTLYDLHELERQMRQQGNELLELQRIAAERQRIELREWQDSQIKANEEQTARMEQLEAWQRKAIEALETIEMRLEQNKRDIESCANRLWQAWFEYMQGHAKLLESIVKQHGAS